MDDVGRLSGPSTDRSGAASTSSAQVCAANSFRKYLYFQNLDAAIVMYINFGSAASAAAGSFKVAAGASIVFGSGSFCPTDAVNVIAASGTPAYTCKEG
jgi:hypothetical protein